MSLKPMFQGIAFSPATALAQNVGAGDTVIRVLDISVFPPPPNFATIGVDETAETIQYNAIVGNELSGCVRGVEGIAQVWPYDTVIARNFTNEDYMRLVDNVANSVQKETDNAQYIQFADGDNFQEKFDAGDLRGQTGAAGAKGVSFYGWNSAAALTDISSINGMAIEDYVVNTYKETVTILGEIASIGTVIQATSATTGKAVGNIRGPVGADAKINEMTDVDLIPGDNMTIDVDKAAKTIKFSSAAGGGSAAETSFDNTNAKLPDDPKDVQKAIEVIAKEAEETSERISSMESSLSGQFSAEITNRLKGDMENSIAIAKTNFLLKSSQSGGIHGLSPNMWVDDLLDDTGIDTLVNAQYDGVNNCIKGNGASATKQGIVIMKPTVADILVPMWGFVTADVINTEVGKWIKTAPPYPADLTAYIPFDELSGNPAPAVGNFTMALTGTSIVDGYHGKGRYFNGSSDYIACNSVVIQAGNKSIRCKINTSGPGAKILDTRKSSGGGGISIHFGDTGYLSIAVRSSSGSQTGINAITKSINDGVWHDVIVTLNNSYAIIYVDGETVISGTIGAESVGGVLVIGESQASSGKFKGVIDEIEVYNTIKTPDDFSRVQPSANASFYLSRNGGITYELVTLDDLMDLSDQPEGNTMIVKAILENDTDQIRGIAWGVK